jgi:nicotinate dehydrogenase subunit B
MTASGLTGPPSLTNYPRLSAWVTLADGQVHVRSGKAELGQGVLTALAQIAAEELDVDVARVRMVAVRTGVSPDESYTAGSLSVQHSGGALRQVCAEVRAVLLASAAAMLATPAERLTVVDGEVTTPDGRRTSWWELSHEALLDREATGAARPKAPADYATVGTDVPRGDLGDKVMGRPRFAHDLRLPGQLFGRVVRPPSRGAALLAVDDAAVRAMEHVTAVVHDGGFVGVVASREEVAVRAVALLGKGCAWSETETLPDEKDLVGYVLSSPADTTVLHAVGDDPEPAPARVVRTRFSRPYLAHASLAPSCGVAVWEDDGVLRVWSHSQGVYNLGREIGRSVGLPEEQVVVEHVEGAGCYGHNAADDAAYDAVLLARAVPGRPVQVVWSREDELTWSPFGPAMVVEVEVGLDPDGRVRSWRHDVWGNGHSSRPSSPGLPPLLAATTQESPREQPAAGDPPMPTGGGSGRNAVPLYDLPQVRVVGHRLTTMPLRTSALRALGAHLNVYAIEQVVDDLALAAGADPVEHRLSLLTDERARAVLLAAAERSGWGTPAAGGRGVGLARYKGVGAWCAVVAEVEAETEVRVTRLTVAVDVGQVVNPDGVVNQVEGGALQAISWTLKEQVRFDRRQVTSTTWDDYPVLTFRDVPPVEVVLLDRPGEPSLGAGETSVGPTAAAIGNAVRDALGVPVRCLPLTPANIVAALG